MTKLCTPVEMPRNLPHIGYGDEVLVLGSCFADHVGRRLAEAGFNVDVNPYGTLYNPASVGKALREILSARVYVAQDLYNYQGCWHSAMHHGDFSRAEKDETLALINRRISGAHQRMSSLKHLLLTFGSAWVYEKDGQVVSNCHKLPEREFRRRKLDVEEIAADYEALLGEIWSVAPEAEITFTVSPIRHLRDGLHQNQLSKATLLLAIDRLQERFADRVHYFPAYELLTDELRDYRFYADDLTHPSALAVELIWERFAQAMMTAETRQVTQQVEDVRKMLRHRPLHEDSENYRQLLERIRSGIETLTERHPRLNLEEEKRECLTRLEKLRK